MFQKKVRVVFSLSVILLLGVVSIARAAPPWQDSLQKSSVLGETLNLGDLNDTEDGAEAEVRDGGYNLGTIMSGRNDMTGDDPGDDDSPDGDSPSDGDPDDGTDGTVRQHPVASALAEYFDVEYEEVMSLHEAGNGFGTIKPIFLPTSWLPQ
jgi:hypothetical protein